MPNEHQALRVWFQLLLYHWWKPALIGDIDIWKGPLLKIKWMHYLKFHLNPKSIRAFRPIRITLVTAPTYKIGLTIPLKHKKIICFANCNIPVWLSQHNVFFISFKTWLNHTSKKQTISHKSRVTWIAWAIWLHNLLSCVVTRTLHKRFCMTSMIKG